MVGIKHTKRDTVIAPYIAQSTNKWEGDDGRWSSFYVSVGTPPQTFRVFPATVDSIVYVPLTEGCTGGGLENIGNCGTIRGANDTNSRGYVHSGSGMSSTYNTLGGYILYPNQNEYILEKGLIFTDTVTLPGPDGSSNITMKNQVVGGGTGLPFWFGTFGLGNTRVQYSSGSPPVDGILAKMRNQSIIPSLSYSYFAGASYNNDYGSLILGGYDNNRLSDQVVSMPVTVTSDNKQLLNVGIEKIFATNTYDGSVQVSALSNTITASIDSSITQMWFPTDVCAVLEKSFGLTYDNSTQLYTVSNSVHDKLVQLNPSLTIRVGSSSIGWTNVVLSYNALDQTAYIPLYNYQQRYFPIKRAANSSQIVLGRAFLQEAYLVVDWERQNFTIGPVAKSSSKSPNVLPITALASSGAPASSSSSVPAVGGGSSSGIGAGAIAGIVVGFLAILALIGGFFFWRRLKNKRNTTGKRFSMRTWRWTAEAPPPYASEPGYLESDKQGAEMAETKVPEANISELPGSSRQMAELTSGNVARHDENTAQLMSTPLHELHGTTASSELDSQSVRARDSLQSATGTVRSPGRASTGPKSPTEPPLFELE